MLFNVHLYRTSNATDDFCIKQRLKRQITKPFGQEVNRKGQAIPKRSNQVLYIVNKWKLLLHVYTADISTKDDLILKKTIIGEFQFLVEEFYDVCERRLFTGK